MLDVIADLGPTFLGSRLKRLSERLQNGASRYVSGLGFDIQPAQMGLLAALDRSPMTVGGLAEAVGTSQPGVTRAIKVLIQKGLVESGQGADLRHKTLMLTAAGKSMMLEITTNVWPRLEQAVKSITDGLDGEFLDQISAIEEALSQKPLELRAGGVQPGLRVRDYEPALQPVFHDINAEWITMMFQLEAADREVLEDPQTHILDPGGAILFVEMAGMGIIGTCALRRTTPNCAELTKMGVRPRARGLKAGEFLLSAAIARAKQMGIDDLYLLTNARCEAAIHLYEKLGFVHDAEVMAKYAARYERCDVAMRFPRFSRIAVINDFKR